jgi:hypothetical protein
MIRSLCLSNGVASHFASRAPHERAPHIKVGDVGRVVDGPERRGQVRVRQEHGTTLFLTDLQTGQTVSHNFDV